MEQALHFMESYGYWAIFMAVLADFLGAPITTIPLLLVAGAMAAAGKMSLATIALLAAVAAVLGDAVWYGLGRTRGQAVLGMMCRLSSNGEQCVTRSTGLTIEYGAAFLLISKFVPGVATFAPPAAGAAGMSLSKFLLLDTAGSLLWGVIFSSAGFLLRERAQSLFNVLSQSGYWSPVALAAVIAIVILLLLKRKYFLMRKRKLGSGTGMR